MKWIPGNLKQWFNDLTTSVKKNASYFKDKPKIERAAIIVAMVAYLPDLKASQAEITRGLKSIHATTDGAFDLSEMRSLVQGHVSDLERETDKEIAKLVLLQKLGQVTAELGKWLIEIAILVAKAEADPGASDPFSEKEKELIRELCRHFKISPSDFGL